MRISDHLRSAFRLAEDTGEVVIPTVKPTEETEEPTVVPQADQDKLQQGKAVQDPTGFLTKAERLLLRKCGWKIKR